MARKIESRLKIRLTLTARTPLHIGGMGSSVDTDLALALNGKGEYYIPGTSLAGALRGWLENRAGEDEGVKGKIRELWGYQKPRRRPRDDTPEQQNESSAQETGKDEHASFVMIGDANITPAPGKQIVVNEVRDSVGIDRVTGAAARQIKFDRAILPRGTQLSFEMVAELGGDKATQAEARYLTHAVLQALKSNQIRFGAAKSRGLGRVEVLTEEIVEQSLMTRDGMLATLRGQGAPATWPTEAPIKLTSRPHITVDINWTPAGPLMVKAERDGIAVDMLPLVSVIDDHLTFVLPGSSIKGAFRSQAERIVRTLKQSEALNPVNGRQDFIRQVEVNEPNQADNPEHASIIGWLFGIAGKPDASDTKGKRHAGPLPGFSAIIIDDCYASLDFDSKQWADIEQAKNEQHLRTSLNAAGLGNTQQAFHVAIDRWLGSAADGFLYSVLEPHGVSWEPIRLTLDLGRLPEDFQKHAVMLLLFTLRDFVAGRIPLGFGANRGMGAVEVTGIAVTAHDDAMGEFSQLQSVNVQAGTLQVGSDALRATLNESWQRWCKPQASKEHPQ